MRCGRAHLGQRGQDISVNCPFDILFFSSSTSSLTWTPTRKEVYNTIFFICSPPNPVYLLLSFAFASAPCSFLSSPSLSCWCFVLLRGPFLLLQLSLAATLEVRPNDCNITFMNLDRIVEKERKYQMEFIKSGKWHLSREKEEQSILDCVRATSNLQLQSCKSLFILIFTEVL